jgi:glutamine synthetase
MALNKHADLLRASIASAGNDLRLGANEAPPAIISAFIGSHLSMILDKIEKSKLNGKISADGQSEMNLNIPKIPEILADNTDRNRTSPFAFTGNKFEFRAVGSADSCSNSMTVLNLIVADQLKEFKKEVDGLIKNKVTKTEAIYQVIKRYIRESKGIRFEGNSYSQEWIDEARKRGLSNHPSTPEALKAYISKDTVKLFKNNKVLTERELEARYEIKLENYIKKIQIESRVIGDLAKNHIIPIAVRYQNTLIENARGLSEVLDSKTYVKLSRNQIQTIKEISEHISEIKTQVDAMLEQRKIANRMGTFEASAAAYHDNVVPYFDTIRKHVDDLELLVDDELWPLPKYRELLFIR